MYRSPSAAPKLGLSVGKVYIVRKLRGGKSRCSRVRVSIDRRRHGIINKGMSRRSFLGLTGSVAAVAGLGLTGCGGSSSDEGSASGSTDSANRGGGVITAGSAYAPSSFDPASTGSAVGLGANWHVVEGIYGIDYHDYSTFNELATDDPKSVDDTTFEVTIRKGAKFSDGTEVHR